MYKKIMNYMQQHQMVHPEECVVVALSGGADSVCLLLILEEIRKSMGFLLAAVHVEHGIRGEESMRDAAFCEELCKKRQIPMALYTVDAPLYAKQMHLSLEEAARQLRYECFQKALDQFGARTISTAHHADDNAETLLFHLVRGSGIRGLGGIRPVSELGFRSDRAKSGAECAITGRSDDAPEDRCAHYRVIRPFLCVSRSEIEQWLSDRNQDYCTDSTNRDIAYARNRIRYQVMPELVQVNPAAAEHLCRTAKEMSQISAYLDEAAMKLGQDCYVVNTTEDHSKRVTIDCASFLKLPGVLQTNLLSQLLAIAAGKRRDISAVHINQLHSLFFMETGKKITLPGGLGGVRCYEQVILESHPVTERNTDSKETEPAVVDLCIPGETMWSDCAVLRAAVRDFDGNFDQIPKNRYTKWFDYDKIKFNVQLRTRRAKDRLMVSAKGAHKKLKDWFIDEKIPRSLRDSVLLLADGSEILWVTGYRISEAYKVTEGTKRILEITLLTKEDEGVYNE